jgi:alkylhydroperoxidase/carboxymuconolactone decarboxylase family protein YurZ
MTETLPNAPSRIAEDHPEVWKAYAQLGKATAEAGPLTDRERRLVKLALAVGAGSEGAVHSHARRAKAENIEAAALRQIALLAIGTCGLPRAVAATTWIDDVL